MSITSLGAMANGTPATNKAQTWGGNNWQSGANGNMPASIPLAKPALGRDPKSRARSRDYLKQYVKFWVIFTHVLKGFYFLLAGVCKKFPI